MVEQLAARAQGPRLAPVGQETARAPALQALGDDMHEKAADELMRLQRPGLHAVAVASVALGTAPLAVRHLEDAMVSAGHAVRVAAEIGQHMPRSCHSLLGVTDPRLAIELVEASSEALWCREGLGLPRKPHSTPGGAGVEGRKELAAEDRAQGVDGQ